MNNALSLIAYPTLAGQVQAMEEDGYAFLTGLLNPAEIAELRAAMDRLVAIPASYDRHDTTGGFLNKTSTTPSTAIRFFYRLWTSRA